MQAARCSSTPRGRPRSYRGGTTRGHSRSSRSSGTRGGFRGRSGRWPRAGRASRLVLRQEAQKSFVGNEDGAVGDAQAAIDELRETEGQGLPERTWEDRFDGDAETVFEGDERKALAQTQGEDDGLGHLATAVRR